MAKYKFSSIHHDRVSRAIQEALLIVNGNVGQNPHYHDMDKEQIAKSTAWENFHEHLDTLEKTEGFVRFIVIKQWLWGLNDTQLLGGVLIVECGGEGRYDMYTFENDDGVESIVKSFNMPHDIMVDDTPHVKSEIWDGSV